MIIEYIIMGNQPLCGKTDTRPDYSHSQYIVCGREPDFRNSTTINIVNHMPVVTGRPLNFQKQSTFKKVERSAAEFCMQNQLDNSFIPIVARIIAYGHNNIFAAYRRLPEGSKYEFLDDIRFLEIDFIDLLYHRYIMGKREPKMIEQTPKSILNRQDLKHNEREEFTKIGLNLLKKKQVGFLFLGAGSSSRFLFQDKFLCPLEMFEGKTLLELMLDRVRKNVGAKPEEKISVPIVFACTTNNRKNIEGFLKSKKYCGFDVAKIRFIQVPMLPILDEKGKICITFEFKIMERPSGTLKCVEELLGSGVYQFLKNEGISFLSISGLENLAENPGDPFSIGYMSDNKLDLVGKCTDPVFSTEQFPRYTLGQNGKVYLVNISEIIDAKLPQNKIGTMLEECPVQMNSVICRFDSLKSMVKNYENSMFLSQEYQANKKSQNFFNFQKERPAVNQLVYVFQKQLGYLFTCTQNHKLIKVPRNQFVPIMGKTGPYSLREAIKIFQKQ